LKILEALDAGRPVVATSIGAEGLERLVGSGVVIADRAQDFADRLVDLLNDRPERERLGRTGNHAVAEHYAWPATLRPLRSLVTGETRG
jgi:glycosyltransferase involved in cell wall biosynthesis